MRTKFSLPAMVPAKVPPPLEMRLTVLAPVLVIVPALPAVVFTLVISPKVWALLRRSTVANRPLRRRFEAVPPLIVGRTAMVSA